LRTVSHARGMSALAPIVLQNSVVIDGHRRVFFQCAAAWY
jgi:hypothetical protein